MDGVEEMRSGKSNDSPDPQQHIAVRGCCPYLSDLKTSDFRSVTFEWWNRAFPKPYEQHEPKATSTVMIAADSFSESSCGKLQKDRFTLPSLAGIDYSFDGPCSGPVYPFEPHVPQPITSLSRRSSHASSTRIFDLSELRTMNADQNSLPACSVGDRRSTPGEVILYLLIATIAAFAGWKIGETNREFVTVPLDISSNAYQFAKLNAATLRANSINSALVYGGIGLCLSVGMILAAKLNSRESCPPAIRSLAAMMLTVAASAAPSFAMIPAFAESSDRDPGSLDLTMPLLVHLGLWCPIGAGVGLLFGITRRRTIGGTTESIISGTVGAVVGTVVYEFAGAILLPTDRTIEPLPATARARLVATMCVTLCITLSLLYSTVRSRQNVIARNESKQPDDLSAA